MARNPCRGLSQSSREFLDSTVSEIEKRSALANELGELVTNTALHGHAREVAGGIGGCHLRSACGDGAHLEAVLEFRFWLIRDARQWLLIFYICHWRSALSIECNVGENLSVASLVRFHQFRELGRRGREGFPA